MICRGDRTASHRALWLATETFVPHSPINGAPERGRGSPTKASLKLFGYPLKNFPGLHIERCQMNQRIDVANQWNLYRYRGMASNFV
ncbi:hypothetical protein D3C87_1876030 [compost metagenome]